MAQAIKSLTVNNFEGVKHIRIEPDGRNLVVIAGANGAGKSSFINGIAEICDPGGTRLIPKPIHDGEVRADVEIVTDEFRAVRTWTKDDAGTLAVYALDGAKYGSGKDFMLSALGGSPFDPSLFVGLSAADQRAALLERVELPFNLAEIDARAKSVFDGRTDANREVKRLEAYRGGLGSVPADTPAEELSAAALLAEAEEARTFNAGLDRQVENITAAESEADRATAEVARLTDELDAARTYLERAEETRESLLAAFRAGPERIDISEITQKLGVIEETNAAVRAAKAIAAADAELNAAKAKAVKLDAELTAIEDTKHAGLASAKFPIEGLSFDDSGITFKGVPFKQVNTAMQRVIALDLATIGQPDLRLIVMKDGDVLDAASLAEVDRIATERGYVVLVERDRDESREIGFVVVDGQVSA